MQVVDSPRLATQGGAPTQGAPILRSRPEERRQGVPGDWVPPPIAEAETPSLVVVPAMNGEHATSLRLAFGRRLQAARERSGVSLDEIAQATKVSPALLASLERGDASRWPKGLFRRAFFRDYVGAIGLPTEPNISEFLQLFPDGEHHPIAAGAVDSAAAPALRLSLAPRTTWKISLADVRQEFLTAGAVLLLALVVTLWVDGTPVTFIGVSGLGYSSRVAMAGVRHIAAIARRRRREVERGAEAPPLR